MVALSGGLVLNASSGWIFNPAGTTVRMIVRACVNGVARGIDWDKGEYETAANHV